MSIVDPHVSFEDWTLKRTPLVVGTNAGSEPLAFQNWRRFKEAFVPELIMRAQSETSKALGRNVESCIDPFSGSGTTALACQFLGITPTVIEVNPFLADLTEAKLSIVDIRMAARRLGEVLGTSLVVDPHEFYSTAPATFVEPGSGDRFLFSLSAATRLASLVTAILTIPEVDIRRLFRVLLGSAAVLVCNAAVSGKGRRYRRNWEQLAKTAADVDAAFIEAVENAIFDIERYSSRRTRSYQVIRGDAREEIHTIGAADMCVFSPPYPNSFDYTDVYNIELWALGYLRSKEDNTRLRKATLRSHVQIKRDFSHANVPHDIKLSIERLRLAPDLWDRHIPEMIGAYFGDLELVLKAVRTKLPLQGRAYLVVGDSKYAGVEVPVAKGLAEMSISLGYEVVASEPFRSMRSSPQQGGREELSETLIVLEAN